MRFVTRLGAIVLILLSLSHGASSATEPNKAAKEALKALYAVDYPASLTHTKAWIEAEPAQAFAYLYEAGILLWWSSAEPDYFNSNEALMTRFRRDMNRALSLSKKRFKDKESSVRADAYFISGLTLGIRAQWDLSRGRWLRAYFNGRKGKKYLTRCLKIDPKYYDAYLGIGLYEYLTDTLPGILKISSFFFLRGNAEEGIEHLQIAMEKGRYPFAATQAASNLVSIYILYEKDYDRALRILRRLLRDYPASPYFRFLEILLLDKTGDWPASHKRAQELYGSASEDQAFFSHKQNSVLCGLAPSQCLESGALTRAVEWLTRALDESAPGPSGWKTLCRLYRGAAYDILGRRPEALADYEAVLSGQDVAGAHEFARRCVENPCGKHMVSRFLSGSAFSFAF